MADLKRPEIIIKITINGEVYDIEGENASIFMASVKHLYSWLYKFDFVLTGAIQNFPILQSFDVLAKAFNKRLPLVPDKYKDEIIALTKEHFPDEPDLEKLYQECEYGEKSIDTDEDL